MRIRFGTLGNQPFYLEPMPTVAFIAIIPALVTVCTDVVVKPYLPTVEKSKVELETRQARIETYRDVLAIPDANQRKAVLSFLVHAHLVDDVDNLTAGSASSIPYWASASTTPP